MSWNTEELLSYLIAFPGVSGGAFTSPAHLTSPARPTSPLRDAKAGLLETCTNPPPSLSCTKAAGEEPLQLVYVNRS